MELKAKDGYRSEVLRPLGADALNSLMSLYQPLVGCAGAALYLTLISEAKHQRSFEPHGRLCQIMNMDITVLERSRRKLEEMMLMRSYIKTGEGKDNYIYVLYPPLEADRFFKHEVLGRLYARIMGAKQYQLSLNKLAHIELSREGFEEVSEQFKSSVIENWDAESEEQFASIKPRYTFDAGDHPAIHFDYERFLTRASNLVFPIEARTNENLRLIGELATMYGLSADEMLILVGRCTDNTNNTLDGEKLRSTAFVMKAKKPAKKVSDDPYDLPPVAFLQSKQNGVPVQDSDKRTIEKLITEMKMDPKVVNILLEHVLSISDNKLVPSFVASLAAAWIRSGVDTAEKAMAEAKKPRGRSGRGGSRKDVLPDYYVQMKTGSEKETAEETDFDREEFEEIRRRLREQEG